MPLHSGPGQLPQKKDMMDMKNMKGMKNSLA
jgi:hypothetical protein